MPAPYALPERIQARLEAANLSDPASGDAVPVLHVADLGRARQDAQRAPAVHVIPYGVAVIDQQPGQVGLREAVIVDVLVRYPNQRSGQRERQLAGDLLRAVVLALAGWKPGDGYTELVAETPPLSEHTASFGAYPFLFSSIYQVD